jgi:ubiquitin C-terminal hydrolase
MKLHEELNKIKKNPDLINKNQIIDQTNHDLVLQHFSLNFSKENKSIISDIFYAINGSIIKCLNCNVYQYDFQSYFFLIFPLEEVWKFKIQKFQNQFNLINNNSMLYQQNLSLFQSISLNINSVNIDDCFQYNEMECFNKENKIYCNRCKNQIPFSFSSKLYTTPEILIIILDRLKDNEFDVKLEFNEEINLVNYVQMKDFGYIYNLIGVIGQFPDLNLIENLISCIKSPIDSEWYGFKDDIIYKVYDFKRQIKDNLKPYILFYQKANL